MARTKAQSFDISLKCVVSVRYMAHNASEYCLINVHFNYNYYKHSKQKKVHLPHVQSCECSYPCWRHEYSPLIASMCPLSAIRSRCLRRSGILMSNPSAPPAPMSILSMEYTRSSGNGPWVASISMHQRKMTTGQGNTTSSELTLDVALHFLQRGSLQGVGGRRYPQVLQ